jgi:hypothetical protein
MSKNTGTSELINYFDLGANGDVGIAGSLDVNTIANATTDTDKFLVSDTGIIKYRTGAELLSDILTNPVTGTGTTNYLPKFTGSTTIGNSQIIDNGTQVGVGLTPNASYGTFQIKAPAGVYSLDLVGRTAGLNSESQITFWNAAQSSALAYLTNTASNLYIGTGANQPFTLSSGGNFIFGSTTDAGYKLDVNGTGRFSGSVNIEHNGNNPLLISTSSTTLFTTYRSNSVVVGYIGNGDGIVTSGGATNFGIRAENDLIFNSGGNNRRLTIAASTGAATFSSSVSGTSLRSSAVGTFGFNTANNGEFQIYATASNGIIMAGRGSSTDMVITNKNGSDVFTIPTGTTIANFVGNVGIGTASPSGAAGTALAIYGGASQARLALKTSSTGDGAGAGFQIGMAGVSAFIEQRENADLTLATNASERMRITSGGNVLIGTTSDAGSRLRVAGNLLINGFQRMYTYVIVVNPSSTGTVTISSPTGTNMQGTMQVMAGGYGNGLTGNITGLWLVGGLLFYNNASTSTITQIVNSVTDFGSMSFQRSGDQYTVTLTNTASSGGSTKSLYVSVIINGD